MICLIHNNAIIVGPTYWPDPAIRQALYVAGYSEAAGFLISPNSVGLPPLPAQEPLAPVDLGGGYMVLPVTVQPDMSPAGEVVSGHTTTVSSGLVTVAPVYDPVPAPPVPALADVKVAKQTEITNKAQTFLSPMAVQYCGLEMTTWDQQAAEAVAVTANPAEPTPLLTPMAQARGMDVPALAARVLTNETAWKAISGHVIGQRLAYQDRLDAATDVPTVQGINVVYTMPGA